MDDVIACAVDAQCRCRRLADPRNRRRMLVMFRLPVRSAADEGLENFADVCWIGLWRVSPAVREIDGAVIIHDASYGGRPFLIGKAHRKLRSGRASDDNDA